MYALLSSLKSLLEVEDVKIDNWMMRLHYILTVTILVGYSAILTVNTYAGDPIDCISNSGTDPGPYIDTYCYIHGTESLTWSSYALKNETRLCGPGDKECVRRHTYYQWVAVVILIQAGLFYLPRYLWYEWEGGKLRSLVGSLAKQPKFHINTDADNSEVLETESLLLTTSGCERTADLARQYLNCMGGNLGYVLKFTIAEFMCLVTAYLQIFLTDKFLGGALSAAGFSMFYDLSKDNHERTDVMSIILPILSSCDFYSWGEGGGKGAINHICVLPNNVLNQKFYVFFLFWMILVAMYTTVHIILRLVIISIPGVRTALTQHRWGELDYQNDSARVVSELLANMPYPDWHVITMIHANLATYNFQLFLEDLAYQHQITREEEKKDN